MLSVLIIDNQVFAQYEKFSRFFNWYTDCGKVVVCRWYKQTGEDIDFEDMVPVLGEKVRNELMWNAYIVDSPFDSEKYLHNDFLNQTQYSVNPYERASLTDNPAEFNDENDPLLQLVYLIGGKGVESYPYVNKYKFRIARPQSIYLLTPRLFENLETQKEFLASEIRRGGYLKNNISGRENRLTDNMYQKVFPDATKRKYMKESEFLLSESIRLAGIMEPSVSDFWNRYHYPPFCRFMVFDLPDKRNQFYDDRWFMLWNALYTMMINVLSNDQLGPYKLYLLTIDLQEKEFEHFFNRYYTMLLLLDEEKKHDIEDLKTKMKRSKNDFSVRGVEPPTPIRSEYQDSGMDSFEVSKSIFGLTKDRPALDEEVWTEEMTDVKKGIDKFFKTLSRAKRIMVADAKKTFSLDLPSLLKVKISKFDEEDLAEVIENSEIEMLTMNPASKANKAIFEKEQQKASNNVRKYLQTRMRKKTVTLITLLSLVLFAVSFIPFIINSAKYSFTSLLISVIIFAAAMGTILLCSLFALLWMKKKLREVLREYNLNIHNLLLSNAAGSDYQAKYLTELLDYMEKYQILHNDNRDTDEMREYVRLCEKKDMLDEMIEQTDEIAGLRHIRLTKLPDEELASRLLKQNSEENIYLYEDVSGVKIELNGLKESLDAPFGYVKGISLTEETIYECMNYIASDETDDPDMFLNDIYVKAENIALKEDSDDQSDRKGGGDQ